MDDAEVVLSPGEAARRLGVSPSGLRRLAVVYGDVHGELQKDAGGTSRVWPQKAVVRLEAARALMAAGQARSIKDALQAVERGDQPATKAAIALGQDSRMAEALGVVATRLEALQDSNTQLHSELTELRAEVRELRALPPSVNPERIDRALEVEMLAGEAEAQRSQDGLLVQTARRLEQLMKRLTGRNTKN